MKLEDGTTLRINYDGHNGYSYTAVGRILIERKLVPREEMSMERIRQWMAANPDQAQELRATNRRLCSSASRAFPTTASRPARKACR